MPAYLNTSNPIYCNRIYNFKLSKQIKTEFKSTLAIILKQLFASGSVKIVE